MNPLQLIRKAFNLEQKPAFVAPPEEKPRQAAMYYYLKNGDLTISPYEKQKKKETLIEMIIRNVQKGRLLAFKDHQIWYCYEISRIKNSIEVAHLYTGQHLASIQNVPFKD